MARCSGVKVRVEAIDPSLVGTKGVFSKVERKEIRVPRAWVVCPVCDHHMFTAYGTVKLAEDKVQVDATIPPHAPRTKEQEETELLKIGNSLAYSVHPPEAIQIAVEAQDLAAKMAAELAETAALEEKVEELKAEVTEPPAEKAPAKKRAPRKKKVAVAAK